MSRLQRREFLAGAGLTAAAAAVLAIPRAAEAGDPSFMNNVPDPLLAGEELPTFKYELEKSAGKVLGAAKPERPLSNSFRSPRGSPGFR